MKWIQLACLLGVVSFSLNTSAISISSLLCLSRYIVCLYNITLTMIFCTVLLLARGIDWDAAGGLGCKRDLIMHYPKVLKI